MPTEIGLGCWGPAELADLPETWLAQWGRRQRWPEYTCQVVVSLTLKAKTQREAQLKPLGLLPTYAEHGWRQGRSKAGSGH